MRLASFLVSGTERWGFVVDEPAAGQQWLVQPGRAEAFLAQYASIPSSGVVATRPHFLGDGWPGTLASFLALEDAGMTALSQLAAYVVRFAASTDATLLSRAGHLVSDVELLAPIPRPRLYWGLVTNSPSFVRNKPDVPIVNLFPLGHQRPQGAVIGLDQPVTMKHKNHLPHLAYNVELAVVIGKAGRDIPLERAMEYVAGYTVVNDVSGTYYFQAVPGNEDADYYSLPAEYSEWFYAATASWGGKKSDTLAPMGPYLVTKDEIIDPYNLLMYTRQSGRTRDRAHSGATLMGIERVIAWYSSFASLYPGDVIHLGTMGVDGLPVSPDDANDPSTRLEVEIESVGTLVNPVQVTDRVAPETHPSYAIRSLASSGDSSIMSPDSWTVATARHFYTSFGNHKASELPHLEVPRFLNGPASSLGVSGADVWVPRRATDLVVSIELAVVLRQLASDVSDASDVVLGYTPLVSVCDQSFADAVAEPARDGERSIGGMYGRWADGFNVVLDSPSVLADHRWHDREMTLDVGGQVVRATTSDYIAGPDQLISTISRMITLFPGDVITLGASAAQVCLTRSEYENGLLVRGEIEGIGEIDANLSPNSNT